MGFLGLFSKSKAPEKLEKLPSGSFRISSTGVISASTLPASFPEERVKRIGEFFVKVFRQAQEQNLPLKEFHVDYSGLKLTGREAKGGAMVFLSPRKF